MSALALLPLVAGVAWGGELRGQLGGEFNRDGHGIADVGFASGPWSATLYTDTLDLRWAPEGERGRAWVAARAVGFAANLLISPWVEGAPRPDLALVARSLGPQVGGVRYLPGGLYAGGSAALTWWTFDNRGAASTAPVPVSQLRPQADALVGWWSPDLHVWMTAGASWAPTTGGLDGVQPGARLTAVSRLEEPVLAPRLELRAGVGGTNDPTTRSLIGGLNPYVVPLAGAAWGEFRAVDYVALRAGPSLQRGAWRVEAVVDAAWGRDLGVTWDDPRALGRPGTEACPTADPSCATPFSAAGFGLLSGWQGDRARVQVDLGVAPWLPRPDAVAASALVLVGWRAPVGADKGYAGPDEEPP